VGPAAPAARPCRRARAWRTRCLALLAWCEWLFYNQHWDGAKATTQATTCMNIGAMLNRPMARARVTKRARNVRFYLRLLVACKTYK